jgi:hypothetical protein
LQSVKQWLYNNGRQRRTKRIAKGRKYAFRHVVAHERKGEVEDETRALSGAIPGTREYFSRYQAGLNAVCDRLTDEEVEEYKAMARDWNERMPPKEIQRA